MDLIIDSLNYWPTNIGCWFLDRLTDGLTDWLTDWLIKCPIDYVNDLRIRGPFCFLIHWRTDWFADWQTHIEWLTNLLINWLTTWQTHGFTRWPMNTFIDCLIVCLADYVIIFLTDWPTIDSLVDWMVRNRSTIDSLNHWHSLSDSIAEWTGFAMRNRLSEYLIYKLIDSPIHWFANLPIHRLPDSLPH